MFSVCKLTNLMKSKKPRPVGKRRPDDIQQILNDQAQRQIERVREYPFKPFVVRPTEVQGRKIVWKRIGKRKHGKSRLEKLLEASIRYELAIKALRRELFSLSLAVARLEREREVDGIWGVELSKRGLPLVLGNPGLDFVGPRPTTHLPWPGFGISGSHGEGGK